MATQPIQTTVASAPPPRNLVLCLDGTGNLFSHGNTNVVKLFQVCQRNDGQLVYYDPGVGTLGDAGYKTSIGRFLNKALGGAIGVGLMNNVAEAYIYLMDTYRPGDRIFLFGFSRGAYTARVLAGFISQCGLFDKGSENLVPYAMRIFLEKPPKKSSKAERPFYALRSTFRRTYGRPFTAEDKPAYQLPIHFLGLWDTVKSYGRLYNPPRIPGEEKNESVHHVRHAIALDEQRVFFPQLHWQFKGKHQDVQEVWFAGVHQDVGGGYHEGDSGLSKIPLDWMLGHARDAGLRVVENEYQHIVRGAKDVGTDRSNKARPDPLAAQHVSLIGPWLAAEALPWLRDGRMCWRPRWKGERARQLPPSAVIHGSVVLRMGQPVESIIPRAAGDAPNRKAPIKERYRPSQGWALTEQQLTTLREGEPALIAATPTAPACLFLPLDPATDDRAGEILLVTLTARDHHFLSEGWRADRGHVVQRLIERRDVARSEAPPKSDHLVAALATIAGRWSAAPVAAQAAQRGR